MVASSEFPRGRHEHHPKTRPKNFLRIDPSTSCFFSLSCARTLTPIGGRRSTSGWTMWPPTKIRSKLCALLRNGTNRSSTHEKNYCPMRSSRRQSGRGATPSKKNGRKCGRCRLNTRSTSPLRSMVSARNFQQAHLIRLPLERSVSTCRLTGSRASTDSTTLCNIASSCVSLS